MIALVTHASGTPSLRSWVVFMSFSDNQVQSHGAGIIADPVSTAKKARRGGGQQAALDRRWDEVQREAARKHILPPYAKTLRMTFTSSLSTMRTGRSPLARSCARGSIPSWE